MPRDLALVTNFYYYIIIWNSRKDLYDIWITEKKVRHTTFIETVAATLQFLIDKQMFIAVSP